MVQKLNLQDFDSGDGGEILETARSLLDFFGFFGVICHDFSKLLHSLRGFLFSVGKDKYIQVELCLQVKDRQNDQSTD